MRCNCGINPKNLTDEHLFAESRELKMLPSLYKRVGIKSISKVPKEFTLGRGHMLFFLYKATYDLQRYTIVLQELKNRGYNVKDESYRWDVYQNCKYLENYTETGKEAEIIKQRITEKIISSPKEYFHYNHKRISKEDAIKKLTNNYKQTN